MVKSWEDVLTLWMKNTKIKKVIFSANEGKESGLIVRSGEQIQGSSWNKLI